MPVHHSVQPVAVETQSTNNAIFETIQSLSARLDGMSSRRVDAVRKAVNLSQLIYMAEMERASRLSPQVGCRFPENFPMSLLGVILVMMVREKMVKKN